MSPLLAARRLAVRHPEADFDSLRDISLDVEKGEIVALVGPNGSGKSTLLRSLGRDLPPRRGHVEMGGAPLASIPRRTLARRVGRLPQDPQSPEGLTVGALVELGRHPHRGFLASLGDEDRRSVADALRAVELGDLAHRSLETLSGGERRRAWIAMALAQGPELLLLDEPTSALDLRHQFEVLDLLVRLNGERGTTIVLSIHDLEQAARIAHRIVLLSRGRIYDVGMPRAVVNEEALLDVFRVHAKVAPTEYALSIHVLGPGDPLRSL